MLKVKVTAKPIRVLEGVSAKTGKPYSMNLQEILVQNGEEVRKYDITLNRGQQPYPAGMYEINPMDLIGFGQFGFTIKSDFPLNPIQAVKAA